MANTVVTLQETQKNISEPPTAIHVQRHHHHTRRIPRGRICAPVAALWGRYQHSVQLADHAGASQSTIVGVLRFRPPVARLDAGGRAADELRSCPATCEADFLSAGVTSNNNQSNSYTMRQRQAWGQAAFDNGWSFTGGQMWSLVTETKHGMDNRTEALPMTIDPQYTVGFSWARQYGVASGEELRQQSVVRGFDGKCAGDADDPQQRSQLRARICGRGRRTLQRCVTTVHDHDNFVDRHCVGDDSLYSGANYSFNPSPDIVAKLAFEPGFGHYEVFGVYSRFRDRVYPCVENFRPRHALRRF